VDLPCIYGFSVHKGLGTIALSALVMTPLDILRVICGSLDRKSKLEREAIPLFV
jgi:hypothetical protein